MTARLRRVVRILWDGWSNLLDEHEARTSQPDLCPDEVPGA